MVLVKNTELVLNLFAHKPMLTGVRKQNLVSVLFEDLHNVPNIAGDNFVRKTQKMVEQFILADSKLFSWAKHRPALSMTEINPESLVMVHRTQYYPEGGVILSKTAATRNVTGIGEYRPTIHTALNKSVTEHSLGNEWNSMEYSIVFPFKETVESMPKSKVIGGIADDFFFLDSIKLPKGSVVLKHNIDIPKGQFRISEVSDGVKLIETSTDDMVKTTDLVIKKMGYTPYNEVLQKHLGATDEEMKLITSLSEKEMIDWYMSIGGNVEQSKKRIQGSIKSMEELKDCYSPQEYAEIMKSYEQNLQKCHIVEKYARKMQSFPKAWQECCKRKNYFHGLHAETPWAVTERVFSGMELISRASKNSWIIKGTDYKLKIVQMLEKIKNDKLLSCKTLGYDIDELIFIIKNSKNPEAANIEIAQKMKFKSMELRNITDNFRKIGADEEICADWENAQKHPPKFLIDQILFMGIKV